MIGVGATLDERFTLDKELGQGGMGTVYRATDQLLGRNVAIKLLKDSGTEADARQIRLEAQILARLVHNKIVRLYDFGEFEREQLPGHGGSERAELRESLAGPAPARSAADLRTGGRGARLRTPPGRDPPRRQTGQRLAHPERRRRSSPTSVYRYRPATKRTRAGPSGAPFGYMSPEQAQGKSLDHRADLYSVGVMVYECATGDRSVCRQCPVRDQPACQRHAPGSPPQESRNLIDAREPDPLASGEAPEPTAALRKHGRTCARRGSRARAAARANQPRAQATGLRSPVEPPLSRTSSADDWKAHPAPANGAGLGRRRNDPALADRPTTGVRPAVFGFSRICPVTFQDFGADVRNRPRGFAWIGRPPGRPRNARESCSKRRSSSRQRSATFAGTSSATSWADLSDAGLFLRRPLDTRNADRGRLLLAMTWLSTVEPTEQAINQAVALLEGGADVRAELDTDRGDQIPGEPRYAR